VKTIDFHPEARVELDDGVNYIESQRAGYGKRLGEAVNSALLRIRNNPEQFARYGGGEVRECIIQKYHYAIYFADLPDRIWIAAFAHGSRRPGYWLRRTPKDAGP
jgi:plasmid stabilization system protein ParE